MSRSIGAGQLIKGSPLNTDTHTHTNGIGNLLAHRNQCHPLSTQPSRRPRRTSSQLPPTQNNLHLPFGIQSQQPGQAKPSCLNVMPRKMSPRKREVCAFGSLFKQGRQNNHPDAGGRQNTSATCNSTPRRRPPGGFVGRGSAPFRGFDQIIGKMRKT